MSLIQILGLYVLFYAEIIKIEVYGGLRKNLDITYRKLCKSVL